MKENLVFNEWCRKVNDPILSDELKAISGDDLEVASRFGSFLEFGTAGVRGLIGAGTNRINFVTISHVSQAFSLYLKKEFKNPSVVVSYDTRKFSYEFAKITSQVFASNGILVYFFELPSPIGLLSFSIRYLNCSGGVMITASHNPPEYNGYKIYNSLGAQPVDVSEISENLKKINPFEYSYESFEEYIAKKKIKFVEKNLKFKYLENFQKKIDFDCFGDIDIVYSPLNGCACELFCDMFKKVENLHIVPEQKFPDSSFKTCRRPDPQFNDSFKLSIDLAKQHNSDLIILNDPDGDRIGVALKSEKDYKILSGIEISALLLNYLAQKRNIKDLIVVKSVVTGGLSESITEFYGAHIYETLPGFKYISEFMHELEKKDQINRFLIGFEESHGILLNSNIRDKDGLSSATFFCEMVSFYKAKSIDCLDILNNLYKKFGYHFQKNISLPRNDLKEIKAIILKFKNYFTSNRENVISISDYLNSEKINIVDNSTSELDFPKSNMICIELKGNNKIFVRASGTEPVIKFYILYNEKTLENSKRLCINFEDIINKILS